MKNTDLLIIRTHYNLQLLTELSIIHSLEASIADTMKIRKDRAKTLVFKLK